MTTWVISVPVWGEPYRKVFLDHTLKCVIGAMTIAGLDEDDVRFILHTDDIEIIAAVAHRGFAVTHLPIPEGESSCLKLANSVRTALRLTEIGKRLMFLNADVVLSREVFAAAEKRFQEGKRLFVCHSTRTAEGAEPPIGEYGRELSEWGWNNRHQWMTDCLYATGRAAGPAIAIFHFGGNTVAHCFTLWPLVFYKEFEIDFRGPSMDEFVDHFQPEMIHIVQSPDEMSCVQPCADNMDYERTWRKLTRRRLYHFGREYASGAMYWQFGHQIVIRGNPRQWAQKIANYVLLGYEPGRLPIRLITHWPVSGQHVIDGMPVRQRLVYKLIKLVLRVSPRIRHTIPRPIRVAFLRLITAF